MRIYICQRKNRETKPCALHLNHPPLYLLAKVIVTVTNAKGLEDKTETVKDGRELDTPLFMVNFILLLVSLSYMCRLFYALELTRLYY